LIYAKQFNQEAVLVTHQELESILIKP